MKHETEACGLERAVGAHQRLRGCSLKPHLRLAVDRGGQEVGRRGVTDIEGDRPVEGTHIDQIARGKAAFLFRRGQGPGLGQEFLHRAQGRDPEDALRSPEVSTRQKSAAHRDALNDGVDPASFGLHRGNAAIHPKLAEGRGGVAFAAKFANRLEEPSVGADLERPLHFAKDEAGPSFAVLPNHRLHRRRRPRRQGGRLRESGRRPKQERESNGRQRDSQASEGGIHFRRSAGARGAKHSAPGATCGPPLNDGSHRSCLLSSTPAGSRR